MDATHGFWRISDKMGCDSMFRESLGQDMMRLEASGEPRVGWDVIRDFRRVSGCMGCDSRFKDSLGQEGMRLEVAGESRAGWDATFIATLHLRPNLTIRGLLRDMCLLSICLPRYPQLYVHLIFTW